MKPQSKPKRTEKWAIELNDPTQLPDLRFIRTEFVIAFALGFGLLLLGTFAAIKYLELNQLNAEVDAQTQTNTVAQTKLDALKATQKLYKKEEAFLAVAAKMRSQHWDAHGMINAVAKHLPSSCTLDLIDCPGETLIIRGTHAGVSEKAADIINNYIDAINAETLFTQKLSPGKLTNASRDPALGVFTFEITFGKHGAPK